MGRARLLRSSVSQHEVLLHALHVEAGWTASPCTLLVTLL